MDKILTERGTYFLRLTSGEGDKYYLNEDTGSVMITNSFGVAKQDGPKATKMFNIELERLKIHSEKSIYKN